MDRLPEKVVEIAKSQIGSPYVFGAWGALCTPEERKKRNRMRPGHPNILSKCQVLRSNNPKSNCDGCKWQGDRCFDCRGFTDWTLKQVGIDLYGEGATTQYSHADNWIERGDIANMPECVCCVFIADGNKKSHTGLYIGGNRTIECSGEVKELDLTSRWTHYAIPKGLYTPEEIDDIRKDHPRPRRLLKKGSKGTDVENLQAILSDRGYKCKIDGIFGSETQKAVKAFQQDNGLNPDGIVGMATWAALLNESGVPIKVYTVTIPHLSWSQAEALQSNYSNVTITEE